MFEFDTRCLTIRPDLPPQSGIWKLGGKVINRIVVLEHPKTPPRGIARQLRGNLPNRARHTTAVLHGGRSSAIGKRWCGPTLGFLVVGEPPQPLTVFGNPAPQMIPVIA